MKNNIIKSIKLLSHILVIVVIFYSCEYKEIADAEYPEQLIYMPAAKHGVFYIDAVALPIGSVPTPGNAYRYVVDVTGNRFSVPLAAYRSGINNDGGFYIDVSINRDTINQLLTIPSELPAETLHLPSDKYSIVSSVEMKDGGELAVFSLDVDLDFLIENAPGKNYAVGVSISSLQRKSNPDLATTVVIIDTDMILPVADFSAIAPADDPKSWDFTNNSAMAVEYAWDFGDNSSVSTERNATHTYTLPGHYTVTLTAFGITGELNKSTKSIEITVL